jgi:large subunit ribosomal protein L23
LEAHDVIRRPLITEKNTALAAQNKYLFEVSKEANKIEVKRAVEEQFNVNVTSVNVLNVKGKIKRVGRNRGRTRSWKKAIVTLVPGQRLDFIEGV